MQKNYLSNKTLLITGGTGSFGKAFTKEILKKNYNLKKLIIFSRDELKQYEMRNELGNNKKIRFFIGDVRDLSRLKLAVKDCDIVIHAAALKQVPAAEYNPFEFVKTNVLGAQNIVQACLNSNVKKVISLSTDKAVSPINLYGATKLCSDKIFLSANNFKGSKNISFSVVRYGNVAGSRGSIMPYLLNSKKNNKTVNLTDKRMTRFNISLKDSVDMVLWSLKNTIGGEIIIPKIPSYKIMDLLKATDNDKNYKVVGIRLGEKINEELIGAADSINTIDIGKYYLTLQTINDNKILKHYKKFKYKTLKPGFSYNSGNNKKFLSVSELKKIVTSL